MDTAYFWTVSIIGVLVVTVGLVALFAVDRRKEARRRAEINQAMVAAAGAAQSVGDAFRAMVPAAEKAAASFRAFGESFQSQPGRHK